MGLDATLYARKKGCELDWDDTAIDPHVTEPNCYELIYWRKFYILHHWFEKQFKPNEFWDLTLLKIPRENLYKLIDDLEKAIQNTKNGPLTFDISMDMINKNEYSYLYYSFDENFINDAKATIFQLKEILEQNQDPYFFYYHS